MSEGPPSTAPSKRSVRDKLTALWLIYTDGDARPYDLLLMFLMVAVGEVMILHSLLVGGTKLITDRWPIAELAIFGVGLLISTNRNQALMSRAIDRYNRAGTDRLLTICDKLSRVDLQTFERIGADRIRQQLTTDAQRVATAGDALVWGAMSWAIAALTATYTATVSPVVMTILFGVLIVVGLLLVLGAAGVNAATQELNPLRDELHTLSEGQIRGFKSVRQHQPRAAAMLAAFKAQVTRYVSQQGQVAQAHYRGDARYRVAYFGSLGAIAFGLPLALPELSLMMRQVLLILVFMRRYVTRPFLVVPQLIEASNALERLDRLEDALDAGLLAAPDAAVELRSFQRIELRGLVHRYPETWHSGGFVCGPIDLSIERGEIVFLTGRNGSGKSTLLKLLTGLYPPGEGQILIDGEPLTPVDMQGYRELFAAVFADFALFERMARGNPGRARALIDEMGLSGVVDFQEQRFSTTALSTGQRKRLALIAARLQGRPIYVLDEWAADQDPEARTRFYREVLPTLKRQGATVIAVTHDDDFFDVADRRIHIEDGRVVTR